jgi:hypothetical protein
MNIFLRSCQQKYWRSLFVSLEIRIKRLIYK